uniref:aminotransferase class V-fold PLP-dependent enzyme n=1 Tax=Ellagibacter isourolithinifaciens TaxID=2137581 RepID=UPI003A8FCA1A
MGRVFNFSAGPAMLPEKVLKTAAAEMLDYNGSGMSIMEMSHRSATFKGIIETAEQDIARLGKVGVARAVDRLVLADIDVVGVGRES